MANVVIKHVVQQSKVFVLILNPIWKFEQGYLSEFCLNFESFYTKFFAFLVSFVLVRNVLSLTTSNEQNEKFLFEDKYFGKYYVVILFDRETIIPTTGV